MIQEIIQKAKTENKKVYIYAHKFPDGDAISSSCAIKEYLQNEGIDAKYVVTNEIRSFKQIVGEIPITKEVDENGISLILDTSTVDYAENDLFKKSEKKDIYVIDHHEKQKDTMCIEDELEIPAENVIRNPNASSTCEIIENELQQEKIDTQIADMLLLGLLTDTAKLRYIKQNTLQNLSKLIECKANYQNIIKFCNRKSNLKDEVGMAKTLIRAKTFQIGDTFGITLPINNEQANNLNRTYGIRNAQKRIFKMADIKNCSFMCMLAQNSQDKYDVEFRSSKIYGNFDVAKLAVMHNGGGHYNASGGYIKIEGNEAKQVQEVIKQEALNLYEKQATNVSKKTLNNEDIELSRILNRTKRLTKAITPEILQRADELVKNGANYDYVFATVGITPKQLLEDEKLARSRTNGDYMLKIEKSLKTFRIQNEILSLIPYSVYNQKSPNVNIKLLPQDIEMLTKKYKVTPEELLYTISAFSNINIESATISLPNGASASINKYGRITTKQRELGNNTYSEEIIK